MNSWLSVDPLAEKAPDWTPYRYGFNNPVRYTDPTGLIEEDHEYLINKNCSVEMTKHTDDDFDLVSFEGSDTTIKIDNQEIMCDLMGTEELGKAEGIQRTLRYAITDENSLDDLKNLFYNAATLTDVEWGLGSITDNNGNNLYGIGTLEHPTRSPGAGHMFSNLKRVNSWIHSHPRPGLDTGDQKESLWGDRRNAISYNHNYPNHIFMGKSHNLWRINLTRNGYDAEKEFVGPLNNYKQIPIK